MEAHDTGKAQTYKKTGYPQLYLHSFVEMENQFYTHMLERFSKWAEEIEQDWAGYSTTYDTHAFILYDSLKQEVARIDYNDGRYDISGTDTPVVEKLTSLTQHRH